MGRRTATAGGLLADGGKKCADIGSELCVMLEPPGVPQHGREIPPGKYTFG
jgi:hypothetical protein